MTKKAPYLFRVRLVQRTATAFNKRLHKKKFLWKWIKKAAAKREIKKRLLFPRLFFPRKGCPRLSFLRSVFRKPFIKRLLERKA